MRTPHIYHLSPSNEPEPEFESKMEGLDRQLRESAVKVHAQTDRIEALIEEELKVGDARSEVYRQGMADVLWLKFEQMEMPRYYKPGTVEFNDYHAGLDRGHQLYRKLPEQG